jgi:carbon-monoxide dehydrogenase medium subunit
VAEKPFRPRSAEAFLESEAISQKVILEAARIASEEANPRTSLVRGSEYYRKEMVRLYLVRMVQEILEGVEGKRDRWS